MSMVTIPESDLKFMVMWTFLTMPIVLWFAFQAVVFVVNILTAIASVWRKP